MLVVGETGDAQGMLDYLQGHLVDYVLMDIAIPGRHGLDVIRDLEGAQPGLLFIVLSTYPEEQYAVRALWAGASGYVSKVSASEELVRAIRRIEAGGKYLSETVLGGTGRAEVAWLRNRLSEREYRIMLMLAAGKSIEQISLEMVLDSQDVNDCRASVLEKLCVRNNRDLTLFAAHSCLL